MLRGFREDRLRKLRRKTTRMRSTGTVRISPARSRRPTSGAARLAANPRDFESAWKLARAQYWLGTQGPSGERRAALERGTDAGRRASTLEPSRPEGFFWMAANMGTLAESYGLRQGIKYRGADQGRARDRAADRPRVSERIGGPRARPLVLQGAGAVRRQQEEVGRAPSQVAHLRSEQHRVALLSRRNAVRHGPRCARHARSCRR